MANLQKENETKVDCEDDVCLLKEESATDSSSAWIDVFCPRYSCEFTSATQLP
jgi:hypothetical protein